MKPRKKPVVFLQTRFHLRSFNSSLLKKKKHQEKTKQSYIHNTNYVSQFSPCCFNKSLCRNISTASLSISRAQQSTRHTAKEPTCRIPFFQLYFSLFSCFCIFSNFLHLFVSSIFSSFSLRGVRRVLPSTQSTTV